MMTPQQFETVLRVRRHQRDRVRMAMARILEEGRSVALRVQHAESVRTEALTALRTMTSGGSVDIDRAAALRYHAARFSLELMELGGAVAANAEHARAARTALAKADRAVKAVERLRDRQEEIEKRNTERRADREATDFFTATNYQAKKLV